MAFDPNEWAPPDSQLVISGQNCGDMVAKSLNPKLQRAGLPQLERGGLAVDTPVKMARATGAPLWRDSQTPFTPQTLAHMPDNTFMVGGTGGADSHAQFIGPNAAGQRGVWSYAPKKGGAYWEDFNEAARKIRARGWNNYTATNPMYGNIRMAGQGKRQQASFDPSQWAPPDQQQFQGKAEPGFWESAKEAFKQGVGGLAGKYGSYIGQREGESREEAAKRIGGATARGLGATGQPAGEGWAGTLGSIAGQLPVSLAELAAILGITKGVGMGPMLGSAAAFGTQKGLEPGATWGETGLAAAEGLAYGAIPGGWGRLRKGAAAGTIGGAATAVSPGEKTKKDWGVGIGVPFALGMLGGRRVKPGEEPAIEPTRVIRPGELPSGSQPFQALPGGATPQLRLPPPEGTFGPEGEFVFSDQVARRVPADDFQIPGPPQRLGLPPVSRPGLPPGQTQTGPGFTMGAPFTGPTPDFTMTYPQRARIVPGDDRALPGPQKRLPGPLRRNLPVVSETLPEPAKVLPAKAEPTPTPAKEPWEMTKGDFDREVMFRGVTDINKDSNAYWTNRLSLAKLYGLDYGKGTGRIRIAYKADAPEEYLGGKSVEDAIAEEERLGQPGIHFGEKAPPVRAEVPSNVEDPHKYLVEQALKEGKPVPPEVLKDYPDLQPKGAGGKVQVPAQDIPQSHQEMVGEATRQGKQVIPELLTGDTKLYGGGPSWEDIKAMYKKARGVILGSSPGFTIHDYEGKSPLISRPLDKLYSVGEGAVNVDMPEISRALLSDKPISVKMVRDMETALRGKGVSEEAITRAKETLAEFNKIRKVGPYIILPNLGEQPKSVILREGVLNTPATEGMRRKRLDKYYGGIKLGEKAVEVGTLPEGGSQRLGVPKEIQGKTPNVFLNLPSTDANLRKERPDVFQYPVVMTGNPHLVNFVRPHPSWDSQIKAIRIKPVYQGTPAVNNAVVNAINYANEIGAHILVTNQRFKSPWRVAQYTDIIPTDPKHPDFSRFWKPNEQPRPTDPRKMPDWAPYLPKGELVKQVLAENGWKTEKDVFGEGGTWYWPESKELPKDVINRIDPNTEIEYCDLFHKGCPACRNCQKLTYPKDQGAPIWGVTDEPFCEMGCPECFVRRGQSGVGGRKGISVVQNLKQLGYGEPGYGEKYPQTINILQKAVRPAGESPDYVSRFFSKSPQEQVNTLASLAMNKKISPQEFAEATSEVKRATGETKLYSGGPSTEDIKAGVKKVKEWWGEREPLTVGGHTWGAVKYSIGKYFGVTKTPEGTKAKRDVTQMAGRWQTDKLQAEALFGDAESRYSGLDRQGFSRLITPIQRGGKSPDPIFQKLYDLYHETNDKLWEKINQYKPLAYLNDYFRQSWSNADDPAIQENIKNYFAGRPFKNYLLQDAQGKPQMETRPYGGKTLTGGRSYFKHRVIPDVETGMMLGLQPREMNPIRHMLNDIAEKSHFVRGMELWDSYFKNKTIKYYRPGSQPAGWQPINDPMGKVSIPYLQRVLEKRAERNLSPAVSTKTGKPVEPNVLQWQAYAPEEVARTFNNWLGKGFRGEPWYDAYRGIVDPMRKIGVSLSTFHLKMTLMTDMAMRGGQSMSKSLGALLTGDLTTAAKEARNLGKLWSGYSFAKEQLSKHGAGRELLEELMRPGAHPELAEIAADMRDAGLLPTSAKSLQPWIENSKGALGEAAMEGMNTLKNLAGARPLKAVQSAWKGVNRFLDATAAPIMEYAVPRAKAAAFASLRKGWLEETGKKYGGVENIPPEVKAQGMYDLARHIDHMMGQINYDALHFNRKLRDLLFFAIKYPGWNLGSANWMYTGARGGIKTLTGQQTTTLDRTAWRTTLGLLASVGVTGMVTQYLLTGSFPDDPRDLYTKGIKTGYKDDYGNDEYVRDATYLKDLQSVLHDPVRTFQSKSPDVLRVMGEIYNNSDYFGTDIRTPGAGIGQQAKELGGYAFTNLALPYSMRNVAASQSPFAKFGSFGGYSPTPRWLKESPLETELSEASRRRTFKQTRQQFESRQLEKELVKKYREDKDPLALQQGLAEAQRTGKLTAKQAQQTFKNAPVPPDIMRFWKSPVDVALTAFERGTPEEKRKYGRLLEEKLKRAVKGKPEWMQNNRERIINVLREIPAQ